MGQNQACCKPSVDTSSESPGKLKNTAFVFIKPHAVTEAVQAFVSEQLAKKGIKVLREGRITAEEIDSQRLIDTHYGAIASRAVLQKPSELVVQEQAKEEFKKVFGVNWSDALAKGLVFNAADAAQKLRVEPLEISRRFDGLKRGVDQVKFGGGFYVGKVSSIYIVNGFYTRMRAKFTEPGTCICYFEVEWDAEALPWEKFRADVIGATNPKEAVPGSIRNTIFQKWAEQGLKAEPDTGDNGVHASASPFEGLVERANWLKVGLTEDAFGKELLARGVAEDALKAWTADPPVVFEGKKQSLFDLLEDLDAEPCAAKAASIAAAA